jgi:hypothetical protein
LRASAAPEAVRFAVSPPEVQVLVHDGYELEKKEIRELRLLRDLRRRASGGGRSTRSGDPGGSELGPVENGV